MTVVGHGKNERWRKCELDGMTGGGNVRRME